MRSSALSSQSRASTDPSGLFFVAGLQSIGDDEAEDAFCQTEVFSSPLCDFRPVVTVRIQSDPVILGARTGIVAMPELDFAALVPNMPGMLMELPCKGRRKYTVRFNLNPEIHTISGNDPSYVQQNSDPSDPPGLLYLSMAEKHRAPRSMFSTVELMLRARRLLKRARSTFHSTRPPQNAVSELR
ncbi:unnamed protein product [Polarella glacialis]|uniref:Uncharacterized protein n=1 Tax=Polarella glacialis TaxID=89957 RepID=A0A813DCC1_POLGL|nr:unnamed protein product [Polarella glacialis]CAE8719738.1 unnamed protein product [Polarella glacialis]